MVSLSVLTLSPRVHGRAPADMNNYLNGVHILGQSWLAAAAVGADFI
jgi:hypothetical protein